MGDRYELRLDCAYCKELNEEVYYAPTCSAMTFKCQKCGRDNFITPDFGSKKMKDVSFQEVKGAIEMASTMMDGAQINKSAKAMFKELRKISGRKPRKDKGVKR